MDKIEHLSSLFAFAHREPLLYLDLYAISRDVEFLYKASKNTENARELVKMFAAPHPISVPLVSKKQAALTWIRANPPADTTVTAYFNKYVLSEHPRLGKKQFKVNMNAEGYVQQNEIWVKLQ